MNVPFLAHCKHSLAQEEDLFSKATFRFLQGNAPEKEEAEELFSLLFREEVSSYSEYLSFLKKVISWIFLVKNEPFVLTEFSLSALVTKICKIGFFGHFPFAGAMQELIFFFLKKPFEFTSPKVLTKGSALIESLGGEKEGHLPDLERGSLLSIFWLLMGKVSGKNEFLNASFHLSSWLLKMIDRETFPFLGLWKEEFHLKEKELLLSLSLMFDLVGDSLQLAEMQKMGGSLWEKSEQKESVPLLFFYALLAKEMQNYQHAESLHFEKQKEEKIWWDQELLLVRYQGKDFESFVTLTGNHSSMGALHLGPIQVRSFGPQWFPLGDPSRFGIVRFPYMQNEQRDWEWSKTSGNYFFRALAPLSSLRGEEGEVLHSSCWMEVKNSVEREKFILDLKFHGEFKERIGFVFYVFSKSCFVEGQLHLLAGSLQRYEGPVRKVIFQDLGSSLQIKAQNLSCMHVIPLGGSGAFWHSNFLLAYEINPQNPLCTFYIEKN